MKREEKNREFFSFFWLNETNHQEIRSQIGRLLIRFERAAILATAAGYSIYTLLRVPAGETALIPFFAQLFFLFLLTAIFYLIHAPARFHSLFYSFYYILLFISVYYVYSWVSGPALLSVEEEFLLTISIILSQALRPGKGSGATVILFLVIHTLIVHPLQLEPGNAEMIRAFLFVWAGSIALFIEAVLYFTTIKYLDLKKQKEKDLKDLILAEKVHNHLFPSFKENEHIRLHVYRSPENKTGGDFYDIIQLREGNLGLFFADISGHGIASAMMSAALKVIISKMPYRFRIQPEAMLTYIDEIMHRDYESHHASAVYLFCDFIARSIHFANGGHPAILRSSQGEEFHELKTTGSLLGYKLSSPVAIQTEVEMVSGDRYFLYTDGLIEYRSQNRDIKAVSSPEELLKGLENLEGEKLIQTALSRMEEREDFLEFHDDILIVLMEIK